MAMERYRTILKLEEIRNLYENGEYEEAGALADTIKEQKIKDTTDLFLLASVYRRTGNYRLAKIYLHRVYEKKSSWRVLEELMDVCLAEKNPQEANEYLKVYCKLSGGDPRNYIYEYRIGRQMHRPDEELLPVLQTLKAEEYSEKYAYELAKMYHRLGMKKECQQECSDLILWFGEGAYVERAKVLLAYYRGELSAADIHAEAERRIREAEERQARAMAERRAYEEKIREQEEQTAETEPEQAESAEEAMEFMAATIEAVDQETETENTADALSENAKEPEISDSPEAEGEPEETEEEPMWEEDHSILSETEAAPQNTENSENKEAASGEFEQFSLFDNMTEVTAETKEENGSESQTDVDEISAMLAASVEEIVQSKPEETAEILPETVKADESLTRAEAEPKKEKAKTEKKQALSEPKPELAAKLAECELTMEGSLHAFARMESVRKQLLRMLEVMCFVRQKCCCVIITGEQGCGKTTLGTYIAKMFYDLGLVKTPRVARISAAKLNTINLEDKQDQLSGCCLIVENAGTLKDEAARKLIKFGEKKGILGGIILEDNMNEINKLLRNSPDCNRVFGTRVHLPKYGEDELLCFAMDKIYSKDYEAEDGVAELLRGYAGELLKASGEENTLKKMQDYVTKAIDSADRRTEGAILAMAAKGDFHEMDVMVVRKEDFE